MNPWERNAMKMVGKPSYPSRMLKDSDGDKVPNVFDCEPYNKKKQGLIHRIGKGVAKKVLRGKTREEAVQSISRAEERAEAKAKARHEARLEYVEEREKAKYKKKLEAYKKRPSVSKTIVSGLDALTRPSPQMNKMYSGNKTVKRKKGKKKKRKKQTYSKPSRPSRPPISEFNFDF